MAADRAEPQAASGTSFSVAAAPLEDVLAAMRQSPNPRAEQFLERLPGLREQDAVRIIYEEACLRIERGDASVTADVLARFPRWARELGVLLECKRLLMEGALVRFPEVGEHLGDFQLVAEIGRGAVGRTFLASQASLAGRLLVLKFTPLGQDEHLSLARLQHMHIVPLYVEQVFPERSIRVLGMPYLGGASLAHLLEALAGLPVAERTGQHLLDALDEAAPVQRPELRATGPFRNYFAQATFVQAMCWIGACLADALQYAHERGLVHLDVKPSNILIAADGQPMLLDFHLAQAPVTPDQPLPERLGGTPGFLAPEQREAMEAVRAGRRVVRPVDGRSDIYSLGLLLYRALEGEGERQDRGGEGKDLPPHRALAACNPGVSIGLSDIVRKCLAPDPNDRYQDAAALASDLRRHLGDLPLRGVANRSPIERWRKWRRRSPGALSRRLIGLGAALSLVLAALLGLALFEQRGGQIDAALAEARQHLAARRYPETLLVLERGEALASQLPAFSARRQEVDALKRQALRGKNVAELHELVDLLRFRFGITPPEPDEARALYRRGRAIWDARGWITRWPGLPRHSDPASGDQVRADLVDLATVLADLCAHGAGAGVAADRAEALGILSAAEAEFGPAAALRRDLARHARELGLGHGRADPAPATIPAAHTAWEHYDLGRSYLRSGEYSLAVAEFQQAIEIRPGEFWPYYYHGICSYKLGRHADAVASLSTAIALAPRTEACYYNRALAYQALGRDSEAIRDDGRALDLDSHFTDAALNRAVLLFRAGRHADALADLARARATASSASALGRIAYNMALVHMARKDMTAARASLREAMAHGDDAARRLAVELELGPP